jgi:hypothetical protein
MIGGILGALAAAVAGVVDMLSLQDAGIKRTAIHHMLINLTVVALYVVNCWTRLQGNVSPNVSLGLSVVAIAMLLVSGWLGGKMVYEAGVAVHAADTAASTGAWTTGSTARASSGAMGGLGMRSDRAMAADSERPSRESDSPRR